MGTRYIQVVSYLVVSYMPATLKPNFLREISQVLNVFEARTLNS